MGYLQALLLAMTVMWIPVRSSDAIAELSFTRGDTASIPCVFGEGTVRSIFWYYDNGTGSYEPILKLFKGDLIIKEDRAELENNSTLILNDVEVQDEGTYRCDVDRQGQSARSNYTKLNVFSLSASSVPVIPQCPLEDESSCEVNGSSPLILTCMLRNIYPLKEAELNWYRGGQYIPSTNDSSRNEDGTFNMIREIKTSKTGNFTCNATFLSANGAENTAVYVRACITPDVRTTPNTKLKGDAIAGIVIGCIIILAVTLMVIIALILRRCHKGPALPNGASGGKDAQPLGALSGTTGMAGSGKSSSSTAGTPEEIEHLVPNEERSSTCQSSDNNNPQGNDSTTGQAESGNPPSDEGELSTHPSSNENDLPTNEGTTGQTESDNSLASSLGNVDRNKAKQSNGGSPSIGQSPEQNDPSGKDGTIGQAESGNASISTTGSLEDKPLLSVEGVSSTLQSSDKQYGNESTTEQPKSRISSASTEGTVDEKNGLLDEGSSSTQPSSEKNDAHGNNRQQQNSASSSCIMATASCANSPGRIATTKELDNLASLLHGDFYTSLAVNLGLEAAEFDNIKRENQTLKDANFKMLLKWQAKQDGGLVIDLDKALNESGCGAFTKQYKEN